MDAPSEAAALPTLPPAVFAIRPSAAFCGAACASAGLPASTKNDKAKTAREPESLMVLESPLGNSTAGGSSLENSLDFVCSIRNEKRTPEQLPERSGISWKDRQEGPRCGERRCLWSDSWHGESSDPTDRSDSSPTAGAARYSWRTAAALP